MNLVEIMRKNYSHHQKHKKINLKKKHIKKDTTQNTQLHTERDT